MFYIWCFFYNDNVLPRKILVDPLFIRIYNHYSFFLSFVRSHLEKNRLRDQISHRKVVLYLESMKLSLVCFTLYLSNCTWLGVMIKTFILYDINLEIVKKPQPLSKSLYTAWIYREKRRSGKKKRKHWSWNTGAI